MMYGYEIENVLKSCYELRKLDVVLCSYEEEILPPHQLPTVYIINSDPAGVSKTEHWFAIFVTDVKEVFYFDPLGIILNSVYHRIKKWPGDFGEMIYNKQLIQNPFSYACGLYCVCFSYWMTIGLPFSAFLELFNTDVVANDRLIEDFFYTIIDDGKGKKTK